MTEVTVYRVEHCRTGQGPYRADELSLSHTYDERHPTPQEDPGMMDRVDEVEVATGKRLLSRGWFEGAAQGRFAFPSMTAYRTWFDRELRERLWLRDYVVREYHVPASEVAVSSVQAIFMPASARKGAVYPVIMGRDLPLETA